MIRQSQTARRPMPRAVSLTCPFALFIIIALVVTGRTNADAPVLPTVLAKRGGLILDDAGTRDRGSKSVIELENGIGLKTALGSWQRSPTDANVWRATWQPGMGHPPVAAYPGLKANNLIVEVTFRYGKATEPWHEQFLRIAADQRPQLNGHIVSAWVNPNGRYTEPGLVLEQVGIGNDKASKRGLLLDHQPMAPEPEHWYTAVLEIVGDEALFRLDDHVAYAQAKLISTPKNLVSLTLGTTWHEIKRVRIWHAEPNPEWQANKESVLKMRKPFTTRPR